MSKKLNVLVLTGAVALVSAGVGASLTSGSLAKEQAYNTVATTATASESKVSTLLDETVYVFMDSAGKVRRVISSDWTKSALDTDQYTKVEKSVDTETPIAMSVKYTLDGKEVSAKDIAGKSGKVTIEYSFTNNKKQGSYYVPYAVVTGLILDNEKFSNVDVENARIINDGSHTVVAGVALPGMQENLGIDKSDFELPSSIKITADAKEFELGMTMSLATSEIFTDIDTDKLSSVDELSSQISKLTDAMDQLMTGSSKLYDGLAELNDKSGALVAGINALTAGSAELKSGMYDADAGVGTIQEGLASVETGLAGLVSGSGDLTDGASSTFDNLLSGAHDNIVAQIKLYAMNQYIQGNIDLDTMKAYVAAAETITDFTQDNYETVLDALAETYTDFATSFNTAKAGLNTYRDGFLVGLGTYTGTVSQLETAMSSLIIPGVDDLKAGTEQLYAGSVSLADGLTELNNSTPSLVSGIAQLKDGSGSLKDGLTKFNDEGVQKLVDAYGDLESFTTKLRDIVNVAKNNNNKARYVYRTDEVKK